MEAFLSLPERLCHVATSIMELPDLFGGRFQPSKPPLLPHLFGAGLPGASTAAGPYSNVHQSPGICQCFSGSIFLKRLFKEAKRAPNALLPLPLLSSGTGQAWGQPACSPWVHVAATVCLLVTFTQTPCHPPAGPTPWANSSRLGKTTHWKVLCSGTLPHHPSFSPPLSMKKRRSAPRQCSDV